MVEKRKAAGRAKGEAPAKRRASAQIIEEAKETPASDPITIEEVTNVLPTKISDGKPLPTVDEPQPLDLPNKEYQSIPQSGVLAESLKRSRNKWLSEGVFERYWTKPSKSKNIAAPENNPDAKSMQVVGQCRLTIEPHVFDAKLFMVKDPNTVNPPYKQSFPAQRPVMQYGPPNGVVVTPPPSYGAPRNLPIHQSPYDQTRPRPIPHAQQQRASPAIDPQSRILPLPHPSPNLQSTNASQPPQSHHSPRPQDETNSGDYAGSTLASLEQSGQNTAAAPSNTNGASQQSIPESDLSLGTSEPRSDPVIHMLAKKAQSDPQLTNLMKIVASGQATEEQLKVFQRHIDELSAILARQREERSKTSVPAPTAPHSTASSSTLPSGGTSTIQGSQAPRDGIKETPVRNGTPKSAASVHSPYPPPAPTPLRPHHATSSSAQPQAYYQSAPPLSKTEMTASPRGPDTRDIVIEFERNGDRFLFPRFSILEYVPGCNVVIASFLIVRRGSSASTSNPNPKSKDNIPPKSNAVSKSKRDARSDVKSVSTPNSSKADSKDDDDEEIDPPIYDPTLDYYQPVTVRFSSDDSKVLSVLRQAVAPPDEVRRYMNDIMDKMTRAEYVYLAMRLPKSEEGDAQEENGTGEEGTPAASESAGRGKKVVRIE